MKSNLYIIPTDTCLGIWCGFADAEWYKNIYQTKGRPAYKPLAVLVKDFDELQKYADLSDEQIEMLKVYPHPFTIVADIKVPYPDFVDADVYSSFGFRVANTCIDSSVSLPETPLFLTSANKSDAPECYTKSDIEVQFNDTSMFVFLEWVCGNKKPSNVFSFKENTINYFRKNY